MQSVVGKFVDLEFSAFLTAMMPNVLSILGNMASMSHETKRELEGSGPLLFNSSILLIRSVVSLKRGKSNCKWLEIKFSKG